MVIEMARALHIYVGRTVAQRSPARLLDAGARDWPSGRGAAKLYIMLAQQGRRSNPFQTWERTP